MSAELEAMKKRRDLMLRINGVAAVIAIMSLVAKFQFQVWWALWPFVAVLLVGFAAQIWFVYSITNPHRSDKASAARPHASKGA